MAEQLLPKAENFGGRRDSTSLWPALRALFVRQLRDEGLLDALRMTLAAARAWQYLPQHRQLFALNAHRRFCDADRLFHLSHRHYLSRGLDPGQRVGSALYHYGWDSRRMNDEYLAAVYGGPGLEVWRRSRGPVVYRLLLRANPRLPHEGAISAVLMSGDIALCEMGYNWVCASLFGPAEGHDPALFIVRNQSVHHDSPALGTFRAHFQQHSPRYLCLAAVCGVALANDRISVVGIRHECQIAYDPAQEDNFRNSYTGFWESFGAVALARLGYRMAVPLPLRELAAIGAKHRRRAIERRRLWQQISQQTQAALECRFRSAHRQAVAEFA